MTAVITKNNVPSEYRGHQIRFIPSSRITGEEGIAALILDAVQAVGASVSIGVATLSALPFVQPETLVESADQALYAAKRQGRNRFIVAEV